MSCPKFLELRLQLWNGVSDRNVSHTQSLVQRLIEPTTTRLLESCTPTESTRLILREQRVRVNERVRRNMPESCCVFVRGSRDLAYQDRAAYTSSV